MEATANDFVLTLLVNGEESPILNREDPIIFTVSIVNWSGILRDNKRRVAGLLRQQPGGVDLVSTPPPAELQNELLDNAGSDSIYLGTTDKPWTAGIRFLQIKNRRKIPLSADIVELHNPAAAPVVRLDAFHSAFADFGIDDGELDGGGAGDIVVRASLHTAGLEIESGDVVIERTSKRSAKSSAKILAKATYEYRRGRYDNAKSLALEVPNNAAAILPALILLGDIEVMERHYEAALKYYTRALAEFNRQWPDRMEEPRALLWKIERVREGLAPF